MAPRIKVFISLRFDCNCGGLKKNLGESPSQKKKIQPGFYQHSFPRVWRSFSPSVTFTTRLLILNCSTLRPHPEDACILGSGWKSLGEHSSSDHCLPSLWPGRPSVCFAQARFCTKVMRKISPSVCLCAARHLSITAVKVWDIIYF